MEKKTDNKTTEITNNNEGNAKIETWYNIPQNLIEFRIPKFYPTEKYPEMVLPAHKTPEILKFKKLVNADFFQLRYQHMILINHQNV